MTPEDWARARVAAMLASDEREQRVIGVMVSTLDGRAAVDGTSAGISSPHDRALFLAWRAVAHGVIVGPRTLESERYRGFGADPPDDAPSPRRFLTISRKLDLDLDTALERRADLPLTVYHEVEADREPPGACEFVRLDEAGPRQALDDARERYGFSRILCEGGPGLLTSALQDGQLTDLHLTYSPLLLGDGPTLLTSDLGGLKVDTVDVDVQDGSIFTHVAVHART